MGPHKFTTMGNVIELTEARAQDYKAVEGILERFDFERVHAYMVLTGWKWLDNAPTIEDIKCSAASLLYSVIDWQDRNPKNEGVCNGTGGFYAYRFKWDGRNHFKLTFEPFRASSY